MQDALFARRGVAQRLGLCTSLRHVLAPLFEVEPRGEVGDEEQHEDAVFLVHHVRLRSMSMVAQMVMFGTLRQSPPWIV